MQELAPEQVILEVVTVDTKGSGQKQVTATARVIQVNRTEVGLGNGSSITIRYEVPAVASTAPEFPRLLKVGEVTPAFLRLKGGAFVPAARHHTFSPMLPQQVKRMNQAPVDPNLPPYQGAGSSGYAVKEDPRKIEQYVQEASAYAVPTIERPEEPATLSVGVAAPEGKPAQEVPVVTEEPPSLTPAERKESVSRRNSLGEDQYQDPTMRKDGFAPPEKNEIAPVDLDSLPVFEPYRAPTPRPVIESRPPAAPPRTGEKLSHAQSGAENDRMVLAANVPGTGVPPASASEVIVEPPPPAPAPPPPAPKPKKTAKAAPPPPQPEPPSEPVPQPAPPAPAKADTPPAPEALPPAAPAAAAPQAPAEPAPKKAKKAKVAAQPTAPATQPAPAPKPQPAAAPPEPRTKPAAEPKDEPLEIQAVPPAPAAPSEAPAPAPAADSNKALSDYADIYALIKKGEQFQIEGKKPEASSTYTKALEALLVLRASNPEFQPFMVEYRIRDLKRKLDALQQK
jgi:hypothetical protein